MRLLRAGTERGLLPGRLEAVGLEDTLEGLGGGTLAGATATGGHGRGGGVSSGRDTVAIQRKMGMSKSPSRESLNTMIHAEDPVATD